jgi:hypothetical protein
LDRVPVPLGDVLGPAVNELFERAGNENSPAQLFVLGPERHGFFPDVSNSALCNRRPSDIPAGISQEVLFRAKGLDLHYPGAAALFAQYVIQLFRRQVGAELPCFARGA